MTDIWMGGTEGSHIERERKYIIDHETTADLIIANLPDFIFMSLPEDEDNALNDFILEQFPEINEDNNELPIKRITDLHKYRPNYYFDTDDQALLKNNITFNLRQRDQDWAITIKFSGSKEDKSVLERIEINSQCDNNVIEESMENGSIQISKVISKVPFIQEAFNKRILPILQNKELKINEHYDIDSNSADYLFGKDGKITISIDKVIINKEDTNRNLYEMEIEIKFTSLKTWLDTISLRAFDHICNLIILQIKESIKNSNDNYEISHLFNKTTQLSKLERVQNKTEQKQASENITALADYLVYTSLEGKGHSTSFLIDFMNRVFNLPALINHQPFYICSYLISMTQAYPDINLPKAENIDLKNYRKLVVSQAIKDFESAIVRFRQDPAQFLVGNEKYLDTSKVLILKLTENSYIMNLIFLSPDFMKLNDEAKSRKSQSYFNFSKSLLKRLLNIFNENSKPLNYFENVQIDLSLIYDDIDLTIERNNTFIQSLSLVNINNENSDNLKSSLKRKFLKGENRLNYLINKRYTLRKEGVRSPLIIVGDNWKSFIEILSGKILVDKRDL